METMVSLSVIGIITLTAVVSFRSYNVTHRIDNIREGIIKDALDMQSNALHGSTSLMCVDAQGNPLTSGSTWGICVSTSPECTCAARTPAGGYGIIFGNKAEASYSLFADIDQGGDYDAGTEDLIAGTKTLLQNYVYTSTPRYFSITDSWVNTSYPVSIIFSLNGTIIIGDGASSNNANVRIQEISIQDKKTGVFSKFYIHTLTGVFYKGELPANSAP